MRKVNITLVRPIFRGSDLTKEEDRWDWNVKDIVQPSNKANMESAIGELKVKVIKDTTTKDPPSVESVTEES